MSLWHPCDEELLGVRRDSFWGMHVWPCGRVSNSSRFMCPCGHDEKEGKTFRSVASVILMGIQTEFWPKPPLPGSSPALTRFKKDFWLQWPRANQLDELTVKITSCPLLWRVVLRESSLHPCVLLRRPRRFRNS